MVSGMRMRELTLKQLTAVPCPTCEVAPGKRCLLHSGAPRSEPHVDRKLSARLRRLRRNEFHVILDVDKSPSANNPLYALVSLVTSSDVEVMPLCDKRESWCLLVQDNT